MLLQFFKNVRLRWLKSSFKLFQKSTLALFFCAFLSKSKPFQFQGNSILIKMLSQVITNGKIIIKRVTSLQTLVTPCNICTNFVFFAHCAKSINKLSRGLKSISYPVIMCIIVQKKKK